MAAIKAMVTKLTSDYVALPAPTGVAVTGSTDTSISLQWNGFRAPAATTSIA